jgi:hypothetical protein
MINLQSVAEEIVQRDDLTARQKVNIVRAIERSAPKRATIESIEDVGRLALTDPNEYERLLRGYRLLFAGAKPKRTRPGRAA